MVKKDKDESCCSPKSRIVSCCSVDALVSVDDRGQMVLPKDIRDKAGIEAGDKLALIACEEDGKISCITLMKADALKEMVKNKLGPVMKELFTE
jgi:AbrB family looped-hinge helix DNA binding protein